METKASIAVCCGTPLVWTFMFSGSEWYCRKCRQSWPMFSVRSVDATPELVEERERNTEWFREIAKDCIPDCSWKKDCPQCKGHGNGYHLEHATDDERRLSAGAYRKLRGGSVPTGS